MPLSASVAFGASLTSEVRATVAARLEACGIRVVAGDEAAQYPGFGLCVFSAVDADVLGALRRSSTAARVLAIFL